MKLHSLITALMVWALLPGCAYYNTFFNTKRAYKEVLEEHARRKEDKPTTTEIQKIDKTIEKASRLLQLHPNSKYIDDALVMLGECFYYKQEYPKALRKFEELTTYYPKSKLVPRAQLWKAQTHLAREDFKSAEAVLLGLLNQHKKGNVYDQAQYYLGEIYFQQEQYPKAAELYKISVKRLSDAKTRAEAYMRLGECQFKLQQFNAAAKAYAQAASDAKDLNLKFKANLEYTRALRADRRFDVAARKLNKMLSEYSTNPDISWVKFELAEIERQRGKIDEATADFAALNNNYKRTEASAAAYFALGEISQNYRRDYEKAKEFYDKVRTENARSEYTLPAQERAKAIDNLLKLKNSIKLLELQRVSVQRGGASASEAHTAEADNGKKTKNRNTSIRRYPSAQLALSNDPRKLEADLASQKLSLAEVFAAELSQPDSALSLYLEVMNSFAQTPAAPRAMYALAIYNEHLQPPATSARDSLLNVLATQYAETPQGAAARRRLGLTPLQIQVETTESQFREAEKAWLADGDPQEAIRLYNEFLSEQPSPDLQSKSLYAIGWIYENELAEGKLAYETYKQLIEKFPTSPYSQKVRKKVTAYDQQLKTEAQTAAAPAPASAVATEPPPASATVNNVPPVPVDDKLRQRIEADRKGEIDEKPAAQPVQEELDEEESTPEKTDTPPDP